MSAPFERTGTAAIKALGLRVESYRHAASGARHLHLASGDDNNAFLVAFRTLPQDSTGIAHILEHVTLCGSRRYPVRDPFFMMLRRSLANAMNAFTSCDCTAYHFASRNPKDFDNLLGVFLDAVFFPLLDPLDFAQEGIRVEPADAADPSSALVYKGVVYNEMKGAMSAPSAQVHQALRARLFPTVAYGRNCGGDPAQIPALRHEDLVAFHARHYRPSNALFLTYGNRPAADHQGRFQSLALSQLEAAGPELRMAEERPLPEPIVAEAPLTVDAESGIEDRAQVLLSWLLGHGADARERMQALLLEGVLLGNSAAPLRRALETTPLGRAPSDLTGVSADMRQAAFTCGLEGTRRERAPAVESLVLEVLDQTARRGIARSSVDAALHRIELEHRSLDAGYYPPGLLLLLRALPALLHDADPVALLDVTPEMTRLREAAGNPGFVENLIRGALLDNPHRVRLSMVPDPALAARLEAEERARLDALGAGMDAEARTRLAGTAAALAARQQAEAEPELLPSLSLDDIRTAPPIPAGSAAAVDGIPGAWFGAATNGLVHEHVVVELPRLAPELLDQVPLFAAFLAEVGSGGRDYLETQERQAEVSGGIGVQLRLLADAGDPHRLRPRLLLSAAGLSRNHGALCALLADTLLDPRFDELARLEELSAQLRARREQAVTQRGHLLAAVAAAAGTGPAGALVHRWEGLEGLRTLRRLEASLSDPARLEALSDQLCRIREALARAPRRLLSVTEAGEREVGRAELEWVWRGRTPVSAGDPFDPDFETVRVRQGWSAVTGVNFCAKAYPAVAEGHPDAAALKVLGPYLRNQFLHREIRERGGAYGAGAGYDADTASFRFFSYRDPRLAETLADFDRALHWLHAANPPAESLRQAILSAVGEIDRPLAPAAEAQATFLAALQGRTPEHRRRFRESVLQVTLDDLRAAAARYLTPERAGIAVIGGAERLRRHRDPPLDVQAL